MFQLGWNHLVWQVCYSPCSSNPTSTLKPALENHTSKTPRYGLHAKMSIWHISWNEKCLGGLHGWWFFDDFDGWSGNPGGVICDNSKWLRSWIYFTIRWSSTYRSDTAALNWGVYIFTQQDGQVMRVFWPNIARAVDQCEAKSMLKRQVLPVFAWTNCQFEGTTILIQKLAQIIRRFWSPKLGYSLASFARYTCRNGTLESYRFLPSWPFLARPKLHYRNQGHWPIFFSISKIVKSTKHKYATKWALVRTPCERVHYIGCR